MAVIDQLKLLGSRKAADRPSTAAAPTAAAADEDDLPIPSGIKAVFLGGVFLLAMLAACYVAAEIVLPIVPALCSVSYCSRRCGCWNGLVVTFVPKVTLSKPCCFNVLSVYANCKPLKSRQTQLLQTLGS
jgi:hypothetical protein